MIKALIVEPTQLAPVGWWRLYSPLKEMRRLYPGQFDYHVRDSVKEGDLMTYDYLILARPSKEEEMGLIATAKKVGVKVVVDYDDDLLNITPMHPAFGTFADPVRQNVIQSATAVADVVWASTPSVKESLGRQDAHVIPNAVHPSWLPDKPAPMKKIAGWRGREQQYVDVVLQMWASGWYDRIKDMPDMWHWFGWMPVPTPREKTRFTKYNNIVQYFDHVKTSGINLLWKPLLPSVFNDGKSNIAWIEATVGGGACVTNYAGKPGWEYCLEDFDFSEKVVSDKWEESRAAIVENYNLIDQARRRLESLML